MSKEDLIRWKAIDKGWQKKDKLRVLDKIRELCSTMYSIQFNEIEELAMMLDEPIDYKLEFSIIRLIREDEIWLTKMKDGSYTLELKAF